MAQDSLTTDQMFDELYDSAVFTENETRTPAFIRQARTKFINKISSIPNKDSEEFRTAYREYYNTCESFLTKEFLIGLLEDSGLTPDQAEKGLAQNTFELFAKSLKDSSAPVLKDKHSTGYIYARRSMCLYSTGKEYRRQYRKTVVDLR